MSNQKPWLGARRCCGIASEIKLLYNKLKFYRRAVFLDVVRHLLWKFVRWGFEHLIDHYLTYCKVLFINIRTWQSFIYSIMTVSVWSQTRSPYWRMRFQWHFWNDLFIFCLIYPKNSLICYAKDIVLYFDPFYSHNYVNAVIWHNKTDDITARFSLRRIRCHYVSMIYLCNRNFHFSLDE